MRIDSRERQAAGGISAMAPVLGTLIAAALAKFAAATQLLHLWH